MLQRLHLLFLPWSESTATPGKALLSCTSLLQSPFCPPPSDVQDDFKARPQETSRDTRGKKMRKRDRRQEKGVFKKQEIEVHQNSRRCSQYSYHLIASPLALSFLLCILPLSCFGFRPGQSGLISQLKYVILGNLLKLCEPQIPNLKNENNTSQKVVKRNKCHDIQTMLGT